MTSFDGLGKILILFGLILVVVGTDCPSLAQDSLDWEIARGSIL